MGAGAGRALGQLALTASKVVKEKPEASKKVFRKAASTAGIAVPGGRDVNAGKAWGMSAAKWLKEKQKAGITD